MRPLVTFGIGAMLVLAGSLTFQQEARVLSLGELQGSQLVAPLLRDEVALGLSSHTHQAALDACALALDSVAGKLLTGADRQKLANTCGTLTRAILLVEPTQSFAWFVAAQTAAFDADWGQMNGALIRSQQSGPFEQWIINERLPLAESNYAYLSTAAKSAADSDVAVLAQNLEGVALLADLYRKYPLQRSHIADLVTQAGPMALQRLVNFVKAAPAAGMP